MASNLRLGIVAAFGCLAILGVLPILASSRPAGVDGLTFTVWLTVWQIIGALPLYLHERAGGRRRLFETAGPDQRRAWAITIVVLTGAMFGLSTYMYVVAAEKSGPVSLAIASQATPLFAMLWEAVFLGKRKTRAELAFTALMIAALVSLTTNGTFRIADISWWSVFALGIPFLWSVAHVLLKTQVLERTTATPNQVTLSRLLVSGVFLLALTLALGEPRALLAGLADFDLQRIALIMGLAYYAELIFWFTAIRAIDVSLASAIEVPTPAVTMLIAVAFTGTGVAAHQVLAMVAIAVGMYGLLISARAARRTAAG
jgi:drug/metabolite transporter (DMT)-like permease